MEDLYQFKNTVLTSEVEMTEIDKTIFKNFDFTFDGKTEFTIPHFSKVEEDFPTSKFQSPVHRASLPLNIVSPKYDKDILSLSCFLVPAAEKKCINLATPCSLKVLLLLSMRVEPALFCVTSRNASRSVPALVVHAGPKSSKMWIKAGVSLLVTALILLDWMFFVVHKM